jgi:hypothetical protein
VSTLVYTFEPEGNVQAISPDGQKVAFGNTSLQVVHVPNPAAIWPIGSGRSLRFIDDDHVTWIRPVSAVTAQRFVADLRAFDANIPPTGDDPFFVAANEFEASGSHWASAFTAARRVAFDNRLLTTGVTSVRMAGQFLLTVRDNVTFEVYLNGVLDWSAPKPTEANEFQISTHGWITYGYYGPAKMITPDGMIHDISVAPWGKEGVARLVHTVDGEVWAWSSTNNRIDEPMVLGRRLTFGTNGKWRSEAECIVLTAFPADTICVAEWDTHGAYVVAGSANLGRSTPLQVHVVPIDTARIPVPDPAVPATLPDIPWKSGPVWTPFDIRASWQATATARQGNVFWFRKGDPVENDPQGDVGAWLDLDPVTNNVGLLADSSTGQKINGLNDWMYFDKARLWFPLVGTSGWSVTYDCEFRWRHHAIAGKATGDPKRVSMAFEVGRAVFKGVEVVYRHTYDASVDDNDIEYSYYDRNMREIRWEMWHKGAMVQHTQPVPFTGTEAFVVAPRPQPYGPIAGEDEMNAPGVTIDSYGTAIRPGQPWAVEFHDRFNDVRGKVEIVNGSLYVSLKNAKGEDRSGNKRPVAVQP